MTEEEYIAPVCANAADDTVRTRAYGIECLTAGAAVAEKTPARTPHFDIDSAPTLVGAVIPFHQIIVSLYPRVRHRKLGSAAGALQRARENVIDAQVVRRAPTSRAWRSPCSFSGRSVRPVCCAVSVHAISPWRTR